MSALRAVGIVFAGVFLGAGGFGIYTIAGAETDPPTAWVASPRPIADPAFQPVAGIVPATPSPAAMAAQPASSPIPVESPTTIELLPVPVPVDDPKPGPPLLLVPLPREVPPGPPLEIAPLAPPEKSVESPTLALPSPPGNPLQLPVGKNTLIPVAPLPPAIAVPTVAAPPEIAPMPLSLRQMTLAAIAGTSLMTAPTSAREEPDKKVAPAVVPAKAEDVAALKTQLDELKTTVEELKKTTRSLRDVVEGSADKGAPDDSLVKMVKKLETTLGALDRKMQEIERKQVELSTRTVEKTPIVPTPMPSPKATVRIVNEYPVEISMLVNGTPHRVEAGKTKDVSIDPGALKYQLLTSGLSEVASAIKDGETITLRVR